MYEAYPGFTPLPDDAILRRHMDLPKFVSLLDSLALSFAGVDELGGPFEGSHFPVNFNTLTVSTPMYARTLSHGGNHQSPSMAGSAMSRVS